MNATPKQSPHDIVLLEGFSAKTIAAIRGIAGEEANKVFTATKGELAELQQSVKDQLGQLTQRVKDLNASNPGDPVVKETAQVVSDAIKDRKVLGDVTQYPVDEAREKLAEDIVRTDDAAKAVDKAERTLEQRVGTTESGIVLLKGRVGKLEEGQTGIKSIAEGAMTVAQASATAFASLIDNGGRIKNTGKVYLLVLGIVAVVYAGGTLLADAWLLEQQVIIPLVAAAVAALPFYLFYPSQGERIIAKAQAEANGGGKVKRKAPKSSAADDHGLTIVSGAAADAAAHAGGGHADASASAAAGH